MIALVAVVGPTAGGKTAFSLVLAEALQTEIVSADALQFYRGFEIGTAMPTAEERARIPHHFVACLDPNDFMSAGEYQRRAREVVARINASGKPAVVVGGSGLYVRALLDGLFPGPPRDPAIRESLKSYAAEHGAEALMRRLEAVDPEYAARLTSRRDLVRIVRALEVYEITGRTFSAWHRIHQEQKSNTQLPAIQVALAWDRATLYQRINERVDRLLAQGWIEEVRRLLEAGYEPAIYRLKAHGYREIVTYLRGEQDFETMRGEIQKVHRNYAKRQLTWFRADPRVHWLDPTASPLDETLALLERYNAGV